MAIRDAFTLEEKDGADEKGGGGGGGTRGIGSILGNSNVSLFWLGESRLLTRPLGLGSQLSNAPS